MIDEKITQLPVKFKSGANPERFLEVVRANMCSHFRGPFLVDDKAAEIECGECGEKLSPMHVLRLMAQQETRWHEMRARYQDEMKRLQERSRTKCQYCGEMTPISKR